MSYTQMSSNAAIFTSYQPLALPNEEDRRAVCGSPHPNPDFTLWQPD